MRKKYRLFKCAHCDRPWHLFYNGNDFPMCSFKTGAEALAYVRAYL